MNEHERRLAASAEAIRDSLAHFGPPEATAKVAIDAYLADLPPESDLPPKPVLVTKEMRDVAFREYIYAYPYHGGEGLASLLDVVIEAILPLSPVIKRAQEWRDAGWPDNAPLAGTSARRLYDSLKEAGL